MDLDGAARLKIVSWNMAKSPAAWSALTFPQPLADVALLQEAIAPSDAIAIETVPGRDAPWVTSGGRRDFCAAVANLSGRARMSPLAAGSLPDAESGMLAVSRPGSLAAATIELEGEPPITVVSLYAAWERSNDGKNIYADASAHRLISDLSALVGSQQGSSHHRGRRPQHPEWPRRERERLLGQALRDGVRALRGPGTSVRRAPASPGPAGGPMAR
jgi:hypothetical protein